MDKVLPARHGSVGEAGDGIRMSVNRTSVHHASQGLKAAPRELSDQRQGVLPASNESACKLERVDYIEGNANTHSSGWE